MARLVISKFLSGAAILSEKIDAMLRALAGTLNGGLTVDNLAPGTQFPPAAFAEGKGLYAIRLEVTRNEFSGVAHNNSIGPARAYVPFASTIVGWGYCGPPACTYVALSVDGGEVSRIDAGLNAADGNRAGSAAANQAVAAGALLSAAGVDIFAAVVFLEAEHQG